MGEAKDTVKGDGPPEKAKKTKVTKDNKNLIERADDLLEDLSRCISIKDEDVIKEGDNQKAENMRKAGLLRAAYSLVNTAKEMMGDY